MKSERLLNILLQNMSIADPMERIGISGYEVYEALFELDLIDIHSDILKPTQIKLAEYIGMTPQGLTKMKKERPKVFELLWIGWVQKCNEAK